MKAIKVIQQLQDSLGWSGVYRALVRSGLIEAVPRRRRDEMWRRWERGAPMQLWQLDVVGEIGLADGSEL